MKKRGSFIAGMLTMALLFGLVGPAYAAYQKQATLNYPGIKITLDGEEVIPKDAAGGIVEPFTIDGTTYLPVRAIGNALGLGVDWDGTTNTVILTSPEDESLGWVGYDCYGHFSVPTLENIVGQEVDPDIFPLSSGDSILFTYDPLTFAEDCPETFAEDYLELLTLYGYEVDSVEDGVVYCVDPVSGITVALYWAEERYFCVLLMGVSAGEGQEVQSGAMGSSAPTPAPATVNFPLHLYSNDGKEYLGKLVTTSYDADGVWNTYGTYGNKYNAKCIWNEYGTYGSEYSDQSIANKYTSTPPKIVDDKGVFWGYLTANTSLPDGWTVTELTQYLKENNQ